MTPVPLDLPLRPSEAAQLGTLILDHAERKALTDDVRNRLAARAAVLQLETVRPYFGSLERDPVHPSAYYLAVDGAHGEPLLLHLATATAPTSSIFYKPLLIGRTRRPNGPEMVINAIPFGPSDEESLAKFAGRIDTAFLPRPQGSRTAIAVGPSEGANGLAAAFEAFRAILKRTGKNLAAIGVPRGAVAREVCSAGLWATIRAGWREGYSTGVEIRVAAGSLESAKEAIRQAASCSSFRIDAAELFAAGEFEMGLQAIEQLHEFIRQTRSAMKTGKSFDLEVSLEGASGVTTPRELEFCLEWLRSRGHGPQLVAPHLAEGEGQIEELMELAAIARLYQCNLSIQGQDRFGPEVLKRIAQATDGRVHYRIEGELAERPGYLNFLAENLVG